MNIRLAILAAAGLGLASCGTLDTSGAEAEVSRFHRQLDAAAFSEIIDGLAPELKTTANQANFIAILEAMHRKLGKTVSTAKQGSSVFADTSSTTVNLTYTTKFERGDAVESFQFRGSSDKLLLSGYNVNSAALILN